MEENREVLYEIGPKFDFLYELTMPTGKKIKSALVYTVLALIIKLFISFSRIKISSASNELLSLIYSVGNILITVALVFSVILLVARIVMQVLEYKGIKYKFYDNYLTFENTFLSQTKKTIEYSNIREVEIRRSILDRILNYGVIIIYTNADKLQGSATVLYGIKNTQEHYNNIQSLIHHGSVTTNPIKTEDGSNSFKDQTDLQNALNKTEVYNESYAESDVNPLSEK